MLLILTCFEFLKTYVKNGKPRRIVEASGYGDVGYIELETGHICFVGHMDAYVKSKVKYKESIRIAILTGDFDPYKDGKYKKTLVLSRTEVLKKMNFTKDYGLLQLVEILNDFVKITGHFPSKKICPKLYVLMRQIKESYVSGDLDNEDEFVSEFDAIPGWEWDS